MKIEIATGSTRLNDDNELFAIYAVYDNGDRIATFPVEKHAQCATLRNALNRYAEKLKDAPRPVGVVAIAWLRSAHFACISEMEHRTDDNDVDMLKFWANRLYIENETRDGVDAWTISDNYERCAALIFYPSSNIWAYQPMYGSERTIEGGFDEALANARIIWTG